MKTLFFVLFLIFLSNPCSAQEKKPRHLQSVEYLTGFGGGNLDRKGKYEHTPFLVNFNYNFKSSTKKKNLPPGIFQFVLEPFVSYVLEPDPNMEVGTNFLFKVNILPKNEKFQPYAKAGTGIIYISQRTREQATQYNFNEIAGFGMSYFFNKDRAFTLEYRYRHISNAGLKDPNRGIDSTFVLCGISYKF